MPEEQKAHRAPSLLRSREARLPKRALFQPVVDLLNGAPLALKVGLIVFPVTLGVMLVVNSMSEEPPVADTPIEIPVAAEDEVAKAPEPPPPPRRAPIDPPPRAAPEPIEDAPAPAGFAYVQIEEARLRTRPTEKSSVAGRIPIGGLVKLYDDLGGWSLVASLPDGPAGFLNKKLLGERKPLALLARAQAFERCTVDEETTVDDCLFAAKQQEQPCLDRCGAVNAGNEAERLRCAEVCSIAFDSCARTCRQSAPKIAKGKRRRR